MPKVSLKLCLIDTGDPEALLRTLDNARGKVARIRLLSLGAPPELPAGLSKALARELETLSGDWHNSRAALWQQALAGCRGRWLLLEAGETLSAAGWHLLKSQREDALLPIRQGDLIAHSPRFFAQGETPLAGHVYPLPPADWKLLAAEIETSATAGNAVALPWLQPAARRDWLASLASTDPLAHPDARYALACAEPEAALAWLQPLATAATAPEKTPLIWQRLARARLLELEPDQALLADWLAADPGLEALPEIACLRAADQPEQALNLLGQAVAALSAPDYAARHPLIEADAHWQPLISLAAQELASGRFAEALVHYQQLLVSVPAKQRGEMRSGLLRAAFLSRRYDLIPPLLGEELPGIPLLVRKLLARLPELAAGRLPADTEALLRQGQTELAGGAPAPLLSSLLLELSVALMRARQPDSAQGLIEALLRQTPDQALLWHNLALCYFMRGQYPEAEARYRRALTTHPDYFLSHFDLFKSLILQGRKTEALSELYAIRMRHPGQPQLAAALRQLEAELPLDQRPPEPVPAFLFVLPVAPGWESGADLALQAFYQEFVPGDGAALAFVAPSPLLAQARAWAEARYAPALLPPVLSLSQPLPLQPGHSAWILPWRLQPGEALLQALEASGLPAITTGMQLQRPAGQPLPARVMTEAAGKQRRVWLEAEVAALANQMRLARAGKLPGRAEAAVHSHQLLPAARPGQVMRIPYSAPDLPQGPGISVCMIVRNEEKVLARCLASIHDQVDEIVVLDTGSSDATCAIARRFAKVRLYESEWPGDFAAARNQALSHATQPWILSLDADEYVGPDFIASLRPYLHQAEQPDAYTFPVHDLDEQGSLKQGSMRLAVPRLFANSPQYHYRGRIHEMVYRADEAEMRYFYLEQLPIYHTGYQAAVVAAKQKRLRDSALLEAMIQEQPDAPETRRMYVLLAGIYARAGDPERALALIGQGLERVHDDVLVRGMLLRRRLQLLYELGRDAEALDAAGPAQGLRDPYVAMYRARSLHRLGHYAEALASAQMALELQDEQALEPDILAMMLDRKDILHDLAMLAEASGQPEQALYYFGRCLKLDPSPANQARYARLHAAVLLGDGLLG